MPVRMVRRICGTDCYPSLGRTLGTGIPREWIELPPHHCQKHRRLCEETQHRFETMRQSREPHPRPLLKHLLDAWFCPKRFESAALYERLGVLFIKRYVPTGGDYFIRRYGIRIVRIRGNLQSLIHFERYTRGLEAIHEIAFLGFLAFSSRRAILHRTTLLGFTFAVVVYVLLILSPAMLQRYNRLRLWALIGRMRAQRMKVQGLASTESERTPSTLTRRENFPGEYDLIRSREYERVVAMNERTPRACPAHLFCR